MKLYLVRHGQSTGNVAGTLLGQGDHLLTELGEEQARAAAARLAPFGPMTLYCSDLARAVATAEYIASAWDDQELSGAPALLPDSRLREIDLGDYEGRPWEEFEADEELTAAFAEDPYRTELPGGESLAHIETRVMAAVRDILDHAEEHKSLRFHCHQTSDQTKSFTGCAGRGHLRIFLVFGLVDCHHLPIGNHDIRGVA